MAAFFSLYITLKLQSQKYICNRMKMKLSFLLVPGLVAGVLATPFEARVRHESRDISHPSWTKRKPLDSIVNVPVRIAMKQRNLEHGMDYLMEV